jgi:hypothetical protein
MVPNPAAMQNPPLNDPTAPNPNEPPVPGLSDRIKRMVPILR